MTPKCFFFIYIYTYNYSLILFAFKVVKCCYSSIILKVACSKLFTQHRLLRRKLLAKFILDEKFNQDIYNIVMLKKSQYQSNQHLIIVIILYRVASGDSPYRNPYRDRVSGAQNLIHYG